MSEGPARIQLLPEVLINQIAAGEVVERPASVLKELIENSLDAGARCIDVEMEEGGVRLIRVRDDGSGIKRDDLKLALCRHATSKIRSLADLEKVFSLGFRGEALPSIGSVSELTLTSRTLESEAGWSVRMEGQAHVTELEPVPHPVGTTVEVRDLFFNVPARRKFLRSERTEYLQILDLVRRMALSHHEVGFRLIHNHRQALNLKAAAHQAGGQRRVREICGADFVSHCIEVDSAVEGVRVSGRVGRSGDAPHLPDIQYLYLNGRMIRDKTIVHALRRAYEGLVPEDQPPAYLLYLEMDPGQVDVNVHPSKSEVRFRDNRLIHDFVYSAVRRALTGPDLLPSIPVAPSSRPYPSIQRRRSGVSTVPEVRDPWGVYSSPGPTVPVSMRDAPKALGGDGLMLGRPLGLLHGRYLLAENRQGLVIVDIQAAMRRLFEERLKTALENGAIRSQPLLIPETAELPRGDTERILNLTGPLSRLGLQVEAAGPGAVMVRQVPALLRGACWTDLLRDIAKISSDGLHLNPEQPLIEVLARHGLEAHVYLSTPDAWDGFLRELEGLACVERFAKAGVWRQLGVEDLACLLRSGEVAPAE